MGRNTPRCLVTPPFVFIYLRTANSKLFVLVFLSIRGIPCHRRPCRQMVHCYSDLNLSPLTSDRPSPEFAEADGVLGGAFQPRSMSRKTFSAFARSCA